MATLTTLVTFDGANGENPEGNLIADAAGDLFGTTFDGGTNNYGTVFEIAKTAGAYASAPNILVNFNDTNGALPSAGLISDAAGNLFGTTYVGGTSSYGTVFELLNNSGGSYTLTTLVSFNGTNGYQPVASLIADAAGDLLSTTVFGGANGYGNVFEVSKTGGSYASTPTTLVSFNGSNGSSPAAGLIADTAGNLFGTTYAGGASTYGTVFEIAKTAGGYASTPTTLTSFDDTDGAGPGAGLIADADGDLFGTTGGGYGTVFELLNNGGGSYTLITLVSFNGTNGVLPSASLIADAVGDLFGTTPGGGTTGGGTVFEIAKTGSGYASTPITLADLSSTTGGGSEGGLIADAAGDLFGTIVRGGASGDGTVFELSGTGLTFHPTITGTAAGHPITDLATVAPFSNVTSTDGNSGQTETMTVTLSAAANGTLSNLDGGTYDATTGVYIDTGTSAAVTAALDGVVFTPTANQVAAGQTVTTTFTITDTDTVGATAMDSTASVVATDVPTLTTLISFSGGDGAAPDSDLITDAAGNLFGTTYFGGGGNGGTVFEIPKTAGGYASTLATLVSFNGINGLNPVAGLITDAAGDLFGTTQDGGVLQGTAFEIVKTAGGYASAPTTLVSFNGADGQASTAGLIADTAGDLFGTTQDGGAHGEGTVYEITKTASGYASAPITLRKV